MKAAYDCGVNFFDTAEAYAGGESEIAMGEAIRHFGWKRNDLVISTKASRSPVGNACVRKCLHMGHRSTGVQNLAPMPSTTRGCRGNTLSRP